MAPTRCGAWEERSHPDGRTNILPRIASPATRGVNPVGSGRAGRCARKSFAWHAPVYLFAPDYAQAHTRGDLLDFRLPDKPEHVGQFRCRRVLLASCACFPGSRRYGDPGSLARCRPGAEVLGRCHPQGVMVVAPRRDAVCAQTLDFGHYGGSIPSPHTRSPGMLSTQGRHFLPATKGGIRWQNLRRWKRR